jgi:hypothetical protein
MIEMNIDPKEIDNFFALRFPQYNPSCDSRQSRVPSATGDLLWRLTKPKSTAVDASPPIRFPKDRGHLPLPAPILSAYTIRFVTYQLLLKKIVLRSQRFLSPQKVGLKPLDQFHQSLFAQIPVVLPVCGRPIANVVAHHPNRLRRLPQIRRNDDAETHPDKKQP